MRRIDRWDEGEGDRLEDRGKCGGSVRKVREGGILRGRAGVHLANLKNGLVSELIEVSSRGRRERCLFL